MIEQEYAFLNHRIDVLEKILIQGNGHKPYLSIIPEIETKIDQIEARMEDIDDKLVLVPQILNSIHNNTEYIQMLKENKKTEKIMKVDIIIGILSAICGALVTAFIGVLFI